MVLSFTSNPRITWRMLIYTIFLFLLTTPFKKFNTKIFHKSNGKVVESKVILIPKVF